jgi:hypothetical protein
MKYLSALISQGSASIGGATFSKNRGGNYIRKRVAPVQPRSSAQQAVRATLASLSGQWKDLGAAVIAAWSALASTITLKDSLGNSYIPTGNQLYVGLNATLTACAESTISAAPASMPAFPDMLPIAVTATAGTPSLAITTSLAGAPTGYVFLVRATPQVSAGIAFFGTSKYRIIGKYAASTFASINALALYNARFGALTAGSKLSVRVTLVQISSGFESMYAEATVVVAA